MTKTDKQIIGSIGEHIATQYLLDNGYEIIVTNYKTQNSEIDIIAKENETIAFVEVKTRKTLYDGIYADLLSTKKMTALCNGALSWIKENDWEGEFRFDLIIVYPSKDKIYTINHQPSIFSPRDI